jgi:5-oxopent-3-ene-1,2,5-tricarboxylate decarboxylase/2-hydroxyhepta-2,4-diene-1,7-dioate isomerase
MKRARIAFDGAVHNAVPVDGTGLRLPDGRMVRENAVTWLPPIQPRTTFALGLNYADHAAELDFKAPDKPLIFLKGPNAFVGHRATSPLPADVGQMHFECELAAVIGVGGRNIARADALKHVAGYTIANDYALREYLENYYRPNFRVKNRDFTTPLGPWLVDAADIPDPQNLNLRTTVNGQTVQSGNTRDMIFDIAFLIEYLSEFMTLSPGDLILTGTPQGVQFLRPGDEVITEIEHIGALVNTIAADPTPIPNY